MVKNYKDQDTEDINIHEVIDSNGRLVVEIKSAKFKTPFKITSRPGTSFYEVSATGKLANRINGLFTSVGDAKTEVLKYIRQSKPSKAIRRDRNWKERHATAIHEDTGN